MPVSEPTFWELVREAFGRRPVVRGLGEVSWNKVAVVVVAILGIGNPGFWLLGIAGELAYLYLSATNPRFRNLIRAKRLEAARGGARQQLERSLADLSAEGQQRFQRLREQCLEVQRISRAVQGTEIGSIDDARLSRLDQLLWLFLRLQVSLELLSHQLGTTNPRELQAEVAALEKELAGLATSSERLRKSKESLLELKRKRIENLGRAAEARQILSAELQRIEQQVELLREEAAISRSPEALSARIDAVTGELTDSDSWMRQHQDLLTELGVEETLAAPPQILERPPAPAQKA